MGSGERRGGFGPALARSVPLGRAVGSVKGSCLADGNFRHRLPNFPRLHHDVTATMKAGRETQTQS